MGALRQSRSFDAEMNGGQQQQPNIAGTFVLSMSQGLPTLIVMIIVLVIIVLFCMWGAPAVRAFCRKKVCCCCPMDEPNLESASIADGSATPTIILLPYGRMLVVDRAVFAQLQADHTGIDFLELSANLIRAQRLQGSSPSILDSDATSKGLSPTSLYFLPPAYEEIFGAKNCDLPPSYSEISIMFRRVSREEPVPRRPSLSWERKTTLRTYASAPFVLVEEAPKRLRHGVSLENTRDFLGRRKSVRDELDAATSMGSRIDEAGGERVVTVEGSGECDVQCLGCERVRGSAASVMELVDRESSV